MAVAAWHVFHPFVKTNVSKTMNCVLLILMDFIQILLSLC